MEYQKTLIWSGNDWLLYELDVRGNIGISAFTKWKQKNQQENITHSEYWTRDLCHSSLMFIQLS